MSRADHDEPLQWHWLYIPLVAYLVLSIAPSILAPIFFVLSLFTIDVPMQPAPTPVSLLAIPLFLGLIFWPFLWLYGYARDALIKYPSSEKSLRLATIMSSAAMSLPCSLLSLSAVKFALVAAFYMHLKFDHKLFSWLFVVPMTFAVGVIIALMILFGVIRR